jgi:hypothetical protein
MKTIRSVEGFSLLEILIAGGLMAGMAMYGANMIGQQQAGMRALMARSEAEAIHENIRKILANPESCAATVMASYATAPADLAPPLSLTSIVLRRQDPASGTWTNTTHFNTSVVYGGGLVKIKSMLLRDQTATDLTPGPKLVLKYEFIGKVTGVNEQTRTFDLAVNYMAPVSLPSYAFSCSTILTGGGNTVAVQMVSSAPGGSGATTVSVQCPAGMKRIACMGTRAASFTDTCDEDECGFIGVGPIPPEGCRLAIDNDTTNPQVWATCIPM